MPIHYIKTPRGFEKTSFFNHGITGAIWRLDCVLKTSMRQDRGSWIEVERKIYERIDNRHDNILRYYGAIEDGIVLQHAPNGNIVEYLRSNPNVPYSLRQKWIDQTLSAVSFLHRNGILHGDLCFRNILLDADLNALLGDFAGSSLDGCDSLIAYSSRHEHPAVLDLGTESEIFALGTVIYEITRGAEPFPSLLAHEVEDAFAAKQYPDDLAACPMEQIIWKCWELQFNSCDDILTASRARGISALDFRAESLG